LIGSSAFFRHGKERQYILRTGTAKPVIDTLTGREQQVLQLVAQEMANKQIAGSLEISENTVKYHLSSLYLKLGVTSRTEAVLSGVRKGWFVL
jgi:NarL family two-component system response regulator YdfI